MLALVSADELEDYREFRLGSSVESVAIQTGSRATDLKTVHQRPALLQDLAWSPRYSARRSIPDVDPVRQMIFSFYNDQLYQIVVQYDQTRTSGLTSDDMIASLTPIYGARLTPKAPRAAREIPGSSPGSTALLAEWQKGETHVSLYRSAYDSGFGLVVLSAPLDGLARTATATAVVMDAREAPVREAALLKKRQDDAKAADAKARDTNKGAFRP
jgi:hypothetical protein